MRQEVYPAVGTMSRKRECGRRLGGCAASRKRDGGHVTNVGRVRVVSSRRCPADEGSVRFVSLSWWWGRGEE